VEHGFVLYVWLAVVFLITTVLEESTFSFFFNTFVIRGSGRPLWILLQYILIVLPVEQPQSGYLHCRQGGNEHSYILHYHYSNNRITQLKNTFSYATVRDCDVEDRYE
jgi:hypothetical protein